MFTNLFQKLLSLGIAVFFAVSLLLLYLNATLPSTAVLQDIELQMPLRVYTTDGKLMAEFGEQKRIPVKLEALPEKMIQAVLSTEDRRFFEHKGVDFRGILRAGMHMLLHRNKEQGGSTITMQVARNFFLTPHKSFIRKINEILLSFKIERELSKERILELYLNKIYFGKRAYGIEAAAQVYFGKTVDELTLPEIALLAGLPQAPSSLNPFQNPEGAMKRRNHVLSRMYFYDFIDEESYQKAIRAPIQTKATISNIECDAPYVAEMVRQSLIERFGEEAYTAGWEVTTTIDSDAQNAATQAVQNHLHAYQDRHGYQGPVKRLGKGSLETWQAALNEIPTNTRLTPVVITDINATQGSALKNNGKIITFSANANYAKKLQKGDIIYLKQTGNTWQITQVPLATAALVALSPENGALFALVGGYDFYLSPFNRATQATRQPGSNFKPFVYAAALENGWTPASIINDAPLVLEDPSLKGALWRPQNDTREFYGPTRLRDGLVFSRNLVSIRLLQTVGIDKTIDILERFGFQKSQLPPSLSLALGTGITTPLEMATAYAVFANGGFKVTPYFITQIKDRTGKIVFTAHPTVACEDCVLPEFRAPRAISAQSAFMITSILADAIHRGTGSKALALGRPDLSGKTGTTNKKMDAWFSGYNSQVAVSTWMGYDENKPLQEYGSQAALPLWIEFMHSYLKGKPVIAPQIPSGLVQAKIDPTTGLLAYPGQKNAIIEIFKTTEVPQTIAPETDPDVAFPEEEEESLF